MTEDRFGIPGLSVSARLAADGSFVITGLHIGGGEHIGRDDYEYVVTVRPAALPALAAALGTDLAGIPEAWDALEVEIVQHGESRWLTEHDVEHETWVA
jgi:predicted NAD-dependent protein-ADP-ribosyltransferase YbiA (DUF1768 family)